MAVERPKLMDFSSVGSDEMGYLTITQNHDLPFSIQRVYWIYGTPPGIERGHHAHVNLEQLIFCIAGTIYLRLEDGLGWSENFMLDCPSEGLYIPPGYWRTMRFSQESVLLCLASAEYDEGDYIRDYELFVEHAREKAK